MTSKFDRLGSALVAYLDAREAYFAAKLAWGDPAEQNDYTSQVSRISLAAADALKLNYDRLNAALEGNPPNLTLARELVDETKAIADKEARGCVEVLDSYLAAMHEPYMRFRATGHLLLDVLQELGNSAKDVLPLEYRAGNLRFDPDTTLADGIIDSQDSIRRMFMRSRVVA